MKYILLILILFTIGCGDDVVISKSEYQRLTGAVPNTYPKIIQIQNFKGVYEDYYVVMSTDNHEYLTNKSGSSSTNWKLLLHYPDCKLCKPKKDTIR